MKKLEIIGTLTAGIAVIAITVGLGLGIGSGHTTHADAAPPFADGQTDPMAGLTELLAPVLQSLGFDDSADVTSDDLVTQLISLTDLLGGSSSDTTTNGAGLFNQNGQSNSVFNWGTAR